jgi:hypothetical protein
MEAFAMPFVWTLIVFIQIGAAHPRAQIVGNNIPQWADCIERGMFEMKTRTGAIAVRCERSQGQPV